MQTGLNYNRYGSYGRQGDRPPVERVYGQRWAEACSIKRMSAEMMREPVRMMPVMMEPMMEQRQQYERMLRY